MPMRLLFDSMEIERKVGAAISAIVPIPGQWFTFRGRVPGQRVTLNHCPNVTRFDCFANGGRVVTGEGSPGTDREAEPEGLPGF